LHSPTASLFVAQSYPPMEAEKSVEVIVVLPGEHWEILGRLKS